MGEREAHQKQGPHGPDGRDLTPTEKDMLQAAMSGAARDAVADGLGIAESTLDSHLHTIFAKLGAESIVEAIRIGIERGCIQCYCRRSSAPSDGPGPELADG